MSELLNKVSSYNIFNYLLPGTLFAAFATYSTDYTLIIEDLFIGVFFYYFLGLTISRIGSLLIEPLLRFLSVVPISTYRAFVDSSAFDEKIELLSEINNMYRTLLSAFIVLFFVILFSKYGNRLPFAPEYGPLLMVVSLALLFLLSYRKQSGYISKRVNLHSAD